MSIEDYQRLTERTDTRKAGTLDSMPDDVLEKFKAAVELYEYEKDDA